MQSSEQARWTGTRREGEEEEEKWSSLLLLLPLASLHPPIQHARMHARMHMRTRHPWIYRACQRMHGILVLCVHGPAAAAACSRSYFHSKVHFKFHNTYIALLAPSFSSAAAFSVLLPAAALTLKPHARAVRGKTACGGFLSTAHRRKEPLDACTATFL